MNTTPDKDPKRTETYSKISAGLAISTGVILAVWDVIPAFWEGRNDTISENVRNFARHAWAFPFFWGALTGHFFINIGQPENYKERFYFLVGVFGMMIVANLATHFGYHLEVPPWARTASLVLGVVAGCLLWPQDA